MGALRFRVAIWLRRQRRSLLLTAVVVGIVGGVALGVVAGTRRTASAPDRYTRSAGGDPDMSITQLSGSPMTDDVAALPGVRRLESLAYVLAIPMAPDGSGPLSQPNTFAGNDDAVGARIVEGRFTNPEAADEFTANQAFAADLKRRFGTKIGDRFTISGYSKEQLRSDLDLTKEQPAITPFEVTLVGITESPSDFEDGSQQAIYSRAFLRDHADVGIIQTLYAIYLDGSTTPPKVMDAFRQLPDGQEAYTTPIQIISDGARRAVHFQAVALWLVSALAIVAAVVIAALVAGRALRVTEDERTSVQALGWTRRHLAAERAAEGAVAGLAAAPIALALSYAATTWFPLGVLAKFEPDLGLRADWLVMGLGAVALGALGATVGAVVGARTRIAQAPQRAVAPLRGDNMPLGVGVHFATVNRRGNRTWATAVVGTIGVAGIVGAAVAGTSLTTIVRHGDRWGLAYDAIYGNPYAPADRDIVTPVVGLPHVAGVSGATIGGITVNGQDVAAFAYATAKGHLTPTVLDGRDATGSDEIGLGAEVMRRLRVDLGDTVAVAGSGGEPRKMEVVGVVVTPDSAGNGAALPFESFDALNPGSSQNLVMVDMDRGAPSSALDAVSKAVFSPPDALPTPTTIKALERVTAGPFLLCGVFALMLLVGAAYLLGASVRSRTRDYGTLRAMGSTRPQLRQVVRWQSVAAVAVATAAGVPLGIVIGSRVVEAIVTSLGIVPGASTPWWLIGAGILTPLVAALLLATMPARRASSPSTNDLWARAATR